jgi:hypothetical protein
VLLGLFALPRGVDDEPDVTDRLLYHLVAKGFAAAVNGPHHRLGVARTLLPDLVILAVMMPDLQRVAGLPAVAGRPVPGPRAGDLSHRPGGEV